MPEPTAAGARERLVRDLRLIREDRSISLDDIRKQTMISMRILEAFEEGSLYEHPAYNQVYLRSFVRGYAESIGIEPEEVVHALEAALEGTYERGLARTYLNVDIPSPAPPAPEEQESSAPEESSAHRPPDGADDDTPVAKPSYDATGDGGTPDGETLAGATGSRTSSPATSDAGGDGHASEASSSIDSAEGTPADTDRTAPEANRSEPVSDTSENDAEEAMSAEGESSTSSAPAPPDPTEAWPSFLSPQSGARTEEQRRARNGRERAEVASPSTSDSDTRAVEDEGTSASPKSEEDLEAEAIEQVARELEQAEHGKQKDAAESASEPETDPSEPPAFEESSEEARWVEDHFKKKEAGEGQGARSVDWDRKPSPAEVATTSPASTPSASESSEMDDEDRVLPLVGSDEDEKSSSLSMTMLGFVIVLGLLVTLVVAWLSGAGLGMGDLEDESPVGPTAESAIGDAGVTPGDTEASTDGGATPPPLEPPADVRLGDTIEFTVLAEDEAVDPIRIKRDRDYRRPYWINQGQATVFPVRNSIVIEDELDNIRLLIEGYPYPLDRRDEENRIEITRESAQAFVETLRGDPVELSSTPDTVAVPPPGPPPPLETTSPDTTGAEATDQAASGSGSSR